MQPKLILQPVSVLVGALLAAVAFLTMSQATVSTPLRVEYMPHPRDMVQIKQGTPYMVPVGRLLVLTGLGDRGTCGSPVSLFVDGKQELAAYPGSYGSGAVAPLPQGLTAPAGSTVTLSGGCGSDFTSGRAWGYLVNQ